MSSVAPASHGAGAIIMFGDGWNPMKPHPLGPKQLAHFFTAQSGLELSVQDWIDDMKSFPSLYYADHVDLSRQGGLLPLSGVAWQRACRAL